MPEYTSWLNILLTFGLFLVSTLLFKLNLSYYTLYNLNMLVLPEKNFIIYLYNITYIISSTYTTYSSTIMLFLYFSIQFLLMFSYFSCTLLTFGFIFQTLVHIQNGVYTSMKNCLYQITKPKNRISVKCFL